MALILLGATPVVAVLSTRSSPLMLVLFTLASIAARVSEGGGVLLWRRIRQSVTSPVAALVMAGLVVIWISTTWAPDQAFAVGYALQLTGNAVLILFALCAAPDFKPGAATRTLMISLTVASVLLLIELMTNGGILTLLGQPPEGAFRLNRVVVTVVVLTPIAILYARMLGSRMLWLPLVVLVVVTSIQSDSGASVLGIFVALAVLGAALCFPVAAVRIVGVGAILVSLAMPLLAPQANSIIPQALHEKMSSASSEVRGEIWRIYADIGREHPIFGFGIEASRFTINSSAERGLSAEAIELLKYGHPHNAPLQIWFELGLTGVLIFAALLTVLLFRMERLPMHLKPYASATFAAVFAIACISHGAWQAWWISLIGILFIWWRSIERADVAASVGVERAVEPEAA
ncbi:O-antigen polymerase [Agaricicola taiwanensis]|uniref:O-antigen polymerase n=1 Tax=Agaricicola taiwanensis TaxID=591372 RepID=A0A8J2YDV5_9RHOB|nr:O-antigen polymerase [Agaricicola taiwanensis]